MDSSPNTDGLPDPNLRYQVQVSFPEPDDAEEWETIKSFATPIEALWSCSECYEMVKHLLGNDEFDRDLEPGYVRIRIRDSREDRLILWENESGGLVGDDPAFLP